MTAAASYRSCVWRQQQHTSTPVEYTYYACVVVAVAVAKDNVSVKGQSTATGGLVISALGVRV
jgi:hypothetical protein